jgi:hypothetical protein
VTPQDVNRDGVAVTRQDDLSAENTYQVQNNGRVILHLTKEGAGDCTATVAMQKSVDGEDVPDKTFTVPETTGEVVSGPYPPNLYNVAGENYFELSFSEVTGLSFAAVRV